MTSASRDAASANPQETAAPVNIRRQRDGRGGRTIKCSQVYHIVRRTARRAELAKPVSPHCCATRTRAAC